MKTLMMLLFLVTSTTPTFANSSAETPPKPLGKGKHNIELATFGNGDQALSDYIVQHLEYPQTARKNAIEGTVQLSFHVLPNGSVHNIKVVEGIGFGCDEEAVNVIQSMPKWNPASSNGKYLASKQQLRIQFKLEM